MSETPLEKLARLAGGVAMLSGPLAHQALGQLLISQSTLVEVAGANVAWAAAMRHPNLAVQVAANTLVPALVVERLSRMEERSLDQQRQRLERLAQAQGQPTPAERQLMALKSLFPVEVIQAIATNEQQRLKAKEGQ